MNFKKILASVAAGAIAVSSLALTAFAADEADGKVEVTVHTSQDWLSGILFGTGIETTYGVNGEEVSTAANPYWTQVNRQEEDVDTVYAGAFGDSDVEGSKQSFTFTADSSDETVILTTISWDNTAGKNVAHQGVNIDLTEAENGKLDVQLVAKGDVGDELVSNWFYVQDAEVVIIPQPSDPDVTTDPDVSTDPDETTDPDVSTDPDETTEPDITPDESSDNSSETGDSEPTPSVKIESEDKSVSVEGAIEEGTVVKVEKPDTIAEDAKEVAYDITLVDADDKAVDLKGAEVTVTIAVPEAFKDAEKLYVYYKNDEGKIAEDMKAELDKENGVLTFKTTHFSTYVISREVKELEVSAAGDTDTDNGDNKNQPTGVVLAIIPAAAAAAGVIISRKRK